MPDRPLAELTEMLGTSRRTCENFEVERGKVEEFARAINGGQLPPDWKRREADQVAPSTFTRVARFPRYQPDDLEGYLGFDLGFDPERTVHGEQEYRFERPVRVGDTLTGVTTLEDIYQREGSRGGDMTFAVLETAFRDEPGDLVVTDRMTRIETGPADA